MKTAPPTKASTLILQRCSYPMIRLILCLILSLPLALSAAGPARLTDDETSRLFTVPHVPELQNAVLESGLDSIIVLHNGWHETLASFSRIKLYDITGRTKIPRQAPEYSVLSMIYQPEEWKDARIIPLEHPDLVPMLDADGKWVSPRFVVENPNISQVMNIIAEIQPIREELRRTTNLLNAVEQARKLGTTSRVLTMFEADDITADEILEYYNNVDKWQILRDRREELLSEIDSARPLIKAAEKLINRINSLKALPDEFLISPDSEGAETVWKRPIESTAATPVMERGRMLDIALASAFASQSPAQVMQAASEFLDFMNDTRSYTSQRYRTIQNFYVRQNPWSLAAWIYLISAALFGLYFFFRHPAYYSTAIGVLSAGLVMHTAAVVIRGYLKGHVPVSNIYESLTFTSWCLMLIALGYEAWNRRGMAGVSAAILGFLFLAGAALMPLHETRIHPLRAVLNSYWLNIHVTMMLISYAAFAISAFFAGLYLIRHWLGREALFGGNPIMPQVQTEEFAYRLVQLGWPILTLGIALGAVWADVAWGRFWGWDPKETWAFITWVGYTVYLHSRMVMGWRGTWSAAACVTGFVLVLITWLGVSYIPMFSGGLHSYASPNTF